MSFSVQPSRIHTPVQESSPVEVKPVNRSTVYAEDSLSSCPVCGGCLSTIVSYVKGFFNWILSFIWNSEAPQPDIGKIKERNAEVFHETLSFCNDQIKNKTSLGQAINASIRDQHFYVAETDFEAARPKPDGKTAFFLHQGDGIELAANLSSRKKNVLLLNPANATEPGGGVIYGARAYEETICRRTALYPCLSDFHKTNSKYLSNGVLISPNVSILRQAQDKDYAFLPEPERYSITILSSAAPRNSALNKESTDYANPAAREEMKKLIFLQLNGAYYRFFDKPESALVLTAFGCGAFAHPPKVVAELYKEVIEKYFPNIFPEIYFAIIDDHNAKQAHNPEGNYKPFADVFKGATVM